MSFKRAVKRQQAKALVELVLKEERLSKNKLKKIIKQYNFKPTLVKQLEFVVGRFKNVKTPKDQEIREAENKNGEEQKREVGETSIKPSE